MIKERKNYSKESSTDMELALFFLDIRNFTRFAEKHPPDALIYIIKNLFENLEALVRQNRGKIIETTGDGFYATFGLAQSDLHESVKDAVLTGFSILNVLKEVNSKYIKGTFNQVLEVGIGLHVGRVGVGALRLNSRDRQIIMGFPVHIASRLESMTRKFDNNFIISSDAFKLLKDKPRYQRQHSMLKNISMEMEMYLIGNKYGSDQPLYLPNSQ